MNLHYLQSYNKWTGQKEVWPAKEMSHQRGSKRNRRLWNHRNKEGVTFLGNGEVNIIMCPGEVK